MIISDNQVKIDPKNGIIICQQAIISFNKY